MKSFARLVDPDKDERIMRRLWDEAKAWLREGKVLEVRVSPESRTGAQNAKFHAICSDLAKSDLTWAGKKRDAAAWKVLLVSGHAVATKEGAEFTPGLEGEFINLRESTALMSKKRSASLIEYSLAFCAQNDIKLSDIESRLHQPTKGT